MKTKTDLINNLPLAQHPAMRAFAPTINEVRSMRYFRSFCRLWSWERVSTVRDNHRIDFRVLSAPDRMRCWTPRGGLLLKHLRSAATASCTSSPHRPWS
jgi:hypothetical protein